MSHWRERLDSRFCAASETIAERTLQGSKMMVRETTEAPPS